MLTPTQARRVYEKLKRDGECFNLGWEQFDLEGICYECGHCFEAHSKMPNLTSPGWSEFGWAIERAREKSWWADFERWLYGTSWKESKPGDWWAWKDVIDPHRFIQSLSEYLEEKA
jgi:hypothetical protein